MVKFIALLKQNILDWSYKCHVCLMDTTFHESLHVLTSSMKHFPHYWPFVRDSGGLISQRPVTRRFDVFFDLRLSEQLRPWQFEPPLHSLWCHCNEYLKMAELSAAVFPVITCLLRTVWPRRHLKMMVRDIHQVGVVNTTKRGTIMSLASKLFYIYIYILMAKCKTAVTPVR